MKPNLIVTLTVALGFAAGVFAQNQNPPAAAPPADNPLAAPPVVAPTAPPAETTQPPAEVKPKKKAAPAQARKPAGYPFRGTLKSADKAAMTFTVAGKEKDRVFAVTSQTRITKNGEPATFADLAADEKISGYARAGKDGKAEAMTVTLGAPAADEAKGGAGKSTDKKAKAKAAATEMN